MQNTTDKTEASQSQTTVPRNKFFDVTIQEKCTRTAVVRVAAPSEKVARRRAQRIVGNHEVRHRQGEDHDYEWFSDAIGAGRTTDVKEVR